MPDKRFDLVVIGGGIVGLSTAMEAVQRFPGLRLAVLEKEPYLAAHQTGHNSGVIHSGLYYKPGSVKARTCVSGAAEMVTLCQKHGIPHQICGKVVVATQASELPGLEELHRRGQANGVPDLAMIGPEQLKELEPHSNGIRALHVPGTAITDYVRVAEKFAEIVKENGGEIQTETEVVEIQRRQGEIVLGTTQGDFGARYVVNCTGLHSDRISRMAGANTDVTIVPFRGEYYELVNIRTHFVRGLIYPVPDPALPFLGVHFTKRVYGEVEAGPNAVLAFKREGYRKSDINLRDMKEMFTYLGFWRMAGKYWQTEIGELYRSFSKAGFVRALQRLVPEIKESDLRPGGSGVRAQALDRRGALLDDFRFVQTQDMIHVVNVPSPAATASIPIGRTIVDMAQESFGLKAIKTRNL